MNLIYFLYSTVVILRVASDRLQKSRALAEKSKITSYKSTDEWSEVFIKYGKYNVYVYDLIDPKKRTPLLDKYRDNAVGKLYICINCEMAAWTAYTLFQFLSNFPQTISADLLDVQNDVFRLYYKGLASTLKLVLRNVGRFINILLNFIHINMYDSYYDTGLIRSLLSLNIKISIIKNIGDTHYGSDKEVEVSEEEITFYDDVEHRDEDSDSDDDSIQKLFADNDVNGDGDEDSDDDDGDDGDNDDGIYGSNNNDGNNNKYEEDQTEGIDGIVVRMIMQSINSFLNFMTLNCDFPSFSHNFDKLSSYSTLKSNRHHLKITKFLKDIRKLQLESLNVCGLNQMLLLDKNQWDWTGVEWKSEEKALRFEKIVEHIILVYDLEVIHLYLDLVFKTIIKTILSKTQTYNNTFPEENITLLRDFYKQFMLDYYNIPSDIIEIFDTFNNYDSIERTDLLQKIDLFMNSVSEIYIGPENQLLNLSLEKFMKFLLDNVDSVKCFLRLYEFLRGEYRTHYVPFLKDTDKFDAFLNTATKADTLTYRPQIRREDLLSVRLQELFNSEVQDETGVCQYIKGLKHYCFMDVLSLNSALTARNTSKSTYSDEVKLYFRKILELMMQLVADKNWLRVIFTAPLIDVYKRMEFLEYDKIPHYLQLVSTVLSEFNAYVLKHCRISGFDYWYPNNANLSFMGRFALFDREISQAWKNMNLIETEHNPYQYLQVLQSYFNQRYFRVHKKHILFNWKSEKRDIGYIDRCTNTVILSSSYSYVFYDIRIKFFAAVTFYEVNKLLNLVVSNELTKGSWCDKFQQLLNDITRENRIPFEYNGILNNVKTLLELIVDKVSQTNIDGRSIIKKNNILTQQIVDQFTRIGVSFVAMNYKPKTDDKCGDTCFDKVLLQIKQMYRRLVKILNLSVDLKYV